MSIAARVETIDVYSAAMRKHIRSHVVTPEAYAQDTTARYPSVYLLHGWSGNFTSWLNEAPQLLTWADEYGCILVFPDGGYDSWYLDSPVDSSVRYETYIIRELIPQIDALFRTRSERKYRAISGLSMGGHGALYLSLRNPEMFHAAGSMCGGVDLRPFKQNDWDLKRILGAPSVHWQNWEEASVVAMIPKVANRVVPHLIIDCGLGDFFLDVNRNLHQMLIKHNIAHEYTERPGEHNAEYWSSAVDMQMLYFFKKWSEK